MEIKTITRIKLTAAEGMMLTNGDVYAHEVFLGAGDSADNWHEIPEAEAQEKLAELEEVLR